MPEGVETTVEDGFATIHFADNEKRGPGLAALLEHTPPELIDKRTRPRVTYTVPEGNAREAGLLDGSFDDPGPAGDGQGYDDGEPDLDWSRPALDAAAVELGLDPAEYSNKPKLLDAIREAKAAAKS